MQKDFEKDVYPVIRRIIQAVLWFDEELLNVALVLAWYYWHLDDGQVEARHYARTAICHVYGGRDLPGVRPSSPKDVWNRLTRREGAGMGNVRDRRPGPDRVASDREDWERLLSACNDRQRELALLIQGDPTLKDKQLAEILGLSKGRVWVMRQEMADLLTQED